MLAESDALSGQNNNSLGRSRFFQKSLPGSPNIGHPLLSNQHNSTEWRPGCDLLEHVIGKPNISGNQRLARGSKALQNLHIRCSGHYIPNPHRNNPFGLRKFGYGQREILIH
jgi:hypothetical protein